MKNEIIPERCPKCKDLKNSPHRKNYSNIEGDGYGYLLCELHSWRTGRHNVPSSWIFDGAYYCFNGKYINCPLFSEWFWDQIIKNSKVKPKKTGGKK